MWSHGNMFILILITSLSSQFHHQIELHTIAGLKTQLQCQELGKKLTNEMTQLNHNLEIKAFCEEGK